MAKEIKFSPFQNIQVALEVHPSFYLVGDFFFFGGKAAWT
jgi:hypothetical protein